MYRETFIKLIKYFGKSQRIRLVLFFLLAVIAGFLEFIGIALIYPFVVLIVNPDAGSAYISYLPQFIQNLSPIMLALTVGLVAMSIFVLKNLYMIFYMFVQSRFLQRWTQTVNNMLMDFFLYAPYKSVQQISDADKFYAVNTLVAQVTNGFVMRVLVLCTNAIIVLFVAGLILYKFFAAGVVTCLFIALSVMFQNKVFRKKVEDLSEKLAPVTKSMIEVTHLVIKCIKDVKILGVEKVFYDRYRDCGKRYTDLNADQIFLNSISPYIVETLIVMSLIILAAIISVGSMGQKEVLVASFAVIVASIFRIAPALNRIQTSIINLPATLNFAQELVNFYEKYQIEYFDKAVKKSCGIMPFERCICFNNVDFSYDTKVKVLNNISFEINKGDFVGIIGLSGAGKSTLADVLTGLLPIDSGEISVDGVTLSESNFAEFRKNIGYVPQKSEVLECSFRENVAWGIEPDKIDDELVIKLLKDVCLWDVVSSYDGGINAVPIIGESGLSGGQKQRLAIARVLYRNPAILLFDEATSALDVKTEHEITNMLQTLGHDRTVIAIAHRLSTLQSCNKLIYLKDGRIVDIGTFSELSDKYADFAELVRLSSIESDD